MEPAELGAEQASSPTSEGILPDETHSSYRDLMR